MAAKPQKKEDKKAAPGRAVAKTSGGAPPPALLKQLKADANKGLSKAQEDNIVPLMYVLQSLSPQVLKQKKDAYIQGAEAGDFWMRGTKTFFKGGEEGDGIVVQACHYAKSYIEWKPNRGGFVARHREMPKDAELKTVKGENGDVDRWVRKNGNHVAESREHVVRVFDTDLEFQGALVFPCGGGKIGTSRQWMTLMNGVKIPGEKDSAPSFSCFYRLRTVPLSNDQGDWFGVNAEHFSDDGSPHWVDEENYEAGKQLCYDFDAGVKQADVDDPEAGTADSEV